VYRAVMASPTGLRVFRAVITAFLVFIFFTAGAMKLTDRFSAKTHLKMKSDFERFAKVHPAAQMGYQINPEKYMKQIGLIELAGATFLLMGPRIFKLFSSLLLSSIMIGAMYTHFQLADPHELYIMPALVLLTLFMKLHFLLIGNQSRVDGKVHQKIN